MSYDASAANQDLTLTEGDDETFSITREKDDGTAMDISNWTFYLTIKNDPEDTDANAVVQKAVTSHTDASNGKTEIDLTSSDTEDLQGSYYYDMAYETDAGSDKTFLIGSIYFEPDVTEA